MRFLTATFHEPQQVSSLLTSFVFVKLNHNDIVIATAKRRVVHDSRNIQRRGMWIHCVDTQSFFESANKIKTFIQIRMPKTIADTRNK